MPAKAAANLETFIARWGDGDSAQERANYAFSLPSFAMFRSISAYLAINGAVLIKGTNILDSVDGGDL
jgi:hypothetical protein